MASATFYATSNASEIETTTTSTLTKGTKTITVSNSKSLTFTGFSSSPGLMMLTGTNITVPSSLPASTKGTVNNISVSNSTSIIFPGVTSNPVAWAVYGTNISSSSSSGFTQASATATVNSNSTSISFTGLSGEPKALIITSTGNTLSSGNSIVLSVVKDSTTTAFNYHNYTAHAYATSGLTISYSGTTLTVSGGSTYKFIGTYTLNYYYGSGTLTFRTTTKDPGSGQASVTFTDSNLTAQPPFFAALMNVSCNSDTNRRVGYAAWNGTTKYQETFTGGSSGWGGWGGSSTPTVNDTSTNLTISYSNGLTLNSGGSGSGGYYHSAGSNTPAYTLYYLTSSDIGSGGSGSTKTIIDCIVKDSSGYLNKKGILPTSTEHDNEGVQISSNITTSFNSSTGFTITSASNSVIFNGTYSIIYYYGNSSLVFNSVEQFLYGGDSSDFGTDLQMDYNDLGCLICINNQGGFDMGYFTSSVIYDGTTIKCNDSLHNISINGAFYDNTDYVYISTGDGNMYLYNYQAIFNIYFLSTTDVSGEANIVTGGKFDSNSIIGTYTNGSTSNTSTSVLRRSWDSANNNVIIRSSTGYFNGTYRLTYYYRSNGGSIYCKSLTSTMTANSQQIQFSGLSSVPPIFMILCNDTISRGTSEYNTVVFYDGTNNVNTTLNSSGVLNNRGSSLTASSASNKLTVASGNNNYIFGINKTYTLYYITSNDVNGTYTSPTVSNLNNSLNNTPSTYTRLTSGECWCGTNITPRASVKYYFALSSIPSNATINSLTLNIKLTNSLSEDTIVRAFYGPQTWNYYTLYISGPRSSSTWTYTLESSPALTQFINNSDRYIEIASPFVDLQAIDIYYVSIAVNYTDSSGNTQTLYVKLNGQYTAVSAVYKKVSGSWVLQNDYSNLMDSDSVYFYQS